MEMKENLLQMHETEPLVPVPLSRFEQLIEVETRAAMLMEYTQAEHFSVSREKIAHYPGFSLKIYKEGQ